MSDIAGQVRPESIVLFNESFATTNEREGAEIAGVIVRRLLAAGIKVFYVTHSFELANRFFREGNAAALFLRAERRAMENAPFGRSR
jgi:DNA mismatch repair ATPase MutS